MYKFGKQSTKNLKECKKDLQRIAEEAILVYDFSVICGHRNKKDQNKAYRNGKSELKWPKGKHNCIPSEAMDLVPYPINWNDEKRFYFLAGLIFGIADQLNIKIEWGGNWKSLKDLPHFQLKRR